MDINYYDIGRRIQEQRRKQGLTQDQLSEMAGLSTQHISGVENGKTKFSFQVIMDIVNVLQVSMDELLCGSLMRGVPVLQNEFMNLLADCSLPEINIILDTVRAVKKALRENIKAH